ncbi:GntR family transcriptional regulator [Nocardioides agariphilus]|uniref:GntR family transcriptional regulator n=1 Tax=Nocardioides agariphilus TaxID=433664 RepID=A0A930VPR1_9ACTN|nr:GntR family transcriptional regulator [Nocardioides agariphilus]MBF4768773.1 GntR family transcriptional regulator [Nocardioides agariphilus]
MVTSDWEFTPVVQQSTPGLIAQQLRESLISGKITAGSQLSEAALAKAFGVSRGPLREAMQRLLQEGLLRSERNRGIFVKELTQDDIADIYDARSAIESAALRMVVSRGASADLSKLRQACANLAKAAASGERQSVSDADLSFHAALVNASGSPRLVRMQATLLAETRMCITALEATQDDVATVVDEHRLILEALESGSLETALERLQDHMQDGVMRLQRAEEV